MNRLTSLLRALVRRPARPAARQPRLALESLEDRRMFSATLVAPVVPSPLLHGVARAEFNRDGLLTRADVIHLFNVADHLEKAVDINGDLDFVATPNSAPTAPIAAPALAELNRIFTHPDRWGLAADVVNLGEKVINYNRANIHYQSQILIASGKLVAGDHVSIMRELVSKWFYGTDLPSLSGFSGVTYKTALGSLFGPKGPSGQDVSIDHLNDDYFLAPLGGLAHSAPDQIKRMFSDNGDGTYTVRFYRYDSATKSAVPDYVTVNLDLPVDADGSLHFAAPVQNGLPAKYNDPTNILWVALAEKAYAQFAEEGWSRPLKGTFTTGVVGHAVSRNAYSAIDTGDPLGTMYQVTGFDSPARKTFDSTLSGFETDLVKSLETVIYTPKTPPTGEQAPLVVHTIYNVTWDGNTADPITFDFYATQSNSNQLKTFQQTTLTTTRVNEFSWWISSYDQETKTWFENSYPDGGGI
jgi:hypothetical protein